MHLSIAAWLLGDFCGVLRPLVASLGSAMGSTDGVELQRERGEAELMLWSSSAEFAWEEVPRIAASIFFMLCQQCCGLGDRPRASRPDLSVNNPGGYPRFSDEQSEDQNFFRTKCRFVLWFFFVIFCHVFFTTQRFLPENSVRREKAQGALLPHDLQQRWKIDVFSSQGAFVVVF
jgi:hypothetical protein